MSDQEKKKNKGDLIDIKSLIGDADGGGYSLDDIMAEYGHPTQPEPPRAQPARGLKPGGKVVAFPGPPPRKDPEPPPQEPQSPEPDPQPAPVIPFPQEESALSAFIKDLGKKADDYADHMFEEDEAIDKQEVRRLERLIPGTDLEEPWMTSMTSTRKRRSTRTPPPAASAVPGGRSLPLPTSRPRSWPGGTAAG